MQAVSYYAVEVGIKRMWLSLMCLTVLSSNPVQEQVLAQCKGDRFQLHQYLTVVKGYNLGNVSIKQTQSSKDNLIGFSSDKQFAWLIETARNELMHIPTKYSAHICETGFNWGGSAVGWLCVSNRTILHSFDLPGNGLSEGRYFDLPGFPCIPKQSI